jgi:HNH endonuclease
MGTGMPSVLVDAAADHGTLSLWGADSTEPAILACAPDRAEVGATVLPVDDETVVRFLAKCSPTDDRGHRWWLGAIDGGVDGSGGYGRFQAGQGPDAVITTAHRYAWTLERGPVPIGLVLRHFCDEALCTALAHLEVGTMADNAWDMLVRPVRAGELDTRGTAGRSRAIREAVLAAVAASATTPVAIGEAVRAAMAAGDPDRHQLKLWG